MWLDYWERNPAGEGQACQKHARAYRHRQQCKSERLWTEGMWLDYWERNPAGEGQSCQKHARAYRHRQQCKSERLWTEGMWLGCWDSAAKVALLR